MSSTGILLSGGIDSSALAFWKRPDCAFFVDYGQATAKGEIRAASQIAKETGIPIEIIKVDCRHLGHGDLAHKEPAPNSPAPEWWPYRNQLLVTITAMRAYSMGVSNLLFGSVKTDRFHADGRAVFFKRLNSVLSMQEGGMQVAAPAIAMTSAELVRISGIPKELLFWTHSCHLDEFACGQCRGCFKHFSIMEELGYVSEAIA